MPELHPVRPVPPMQRDMDLAMHRAPSTQALAGETITLVYDHGEELTLEFGTADLRWRSTNGQSGQDAYDAVELRDGVFFVHHASHDAELGRSHVIDRAGRRAVTGWDDASGRDVLRRFVHAARLADHDGAYVPISESRELIGRRAYCQYSGEAALEHVYLNSAAIVWQWLLLPDDPRFDVLRTEVGIEAVSMRKVGEDLFFLTLNDGGPVGLTLLMDFAQKRNVGMLFGRVSSGLLSRPVGANIVLLNEATYPAGFAPG
jgi:hypothetical protein